MIRILHTGDLHLGMESYGRMDPATGLSTRVGDFLSSFDELVDYALASSVDLVLFCGDAYKTRDPSPTFQREFARRIARLAGDGIAVFLLVGNHDLPNALGRATSVEIFQTLDVKNVYVANRVETQVVWTRHGPVQVVSLPWVSRSFLLSREEARGKSLEEVNGLILEKMQNVVAARIAELDPSVPAVLAAHAAVFGVQYGSERRALLGQEVIIPRGTILNPAFDYVALGHIHKHQVISNMPLAIYAGSLQRIDFGEEDEPKGYVVVDLPERKEAGGSADGQVPEFCFRPSLAREFLTIQVDADTDDPTSAVLQAIAAQEARLKDAVVRLQIKVSARREGLIQDAAIQKALKDAYYVAAVSKEVQREHRARLGSRSIDEMTPVEALRLYFLTRKTPPDRLEELMEYGERLIREATL
ncbi:MAG: exonuclease SbcCD subunit D [Chloroflexi bacterium]|nr:exonuclease SbcCD subunit D [Chloroflexota bacterium]